MPRNPSAKQIIRRPPWSFQSMAWKAPPVRRPPAVVQGADRAGSLTYPLPVAALQPATRALPRRAGRLPQAARPLNRQFMPRSQIAPGRPRLRRRWALSGNGARLSRQVHPQNATGYIQRMASTPDILRARHLSRRLVNGPPQVTLRARSTQAAPTVKPIISRPATPLSDTAAAARLAEARIAAKMQAQRISLLAG